MAGDPASGQHVNPNAALNAWVPLDGAFKQFTFAPGMDLQTAVPLDADALLAAARQGATVNEAEGWVQNLNQAAIQNQLTAYQARLKTYIDRQTSGANTTVGDVIGKKIIPERMPAMLAGTTAYQVVLQGAQAASIPDALQHKFTYKLYASDADRSDDNPLLSFTEKTSQLVGKRVTLTYAPATQADADLIASYLPKPNADGSPIRPDQLPTSLPGYLIRLTPQISVDGQVVAKAKDAMTMGTDLYSQGGFTQLSDTTQWDLSTEESNVVGQVTAIGISAGGISAQQLRDAKDRLSATQLIIRNLGNNPSAASISAAGLQGEQISSEFLTAAVWTWFSSAQRHGEIHQIQDGVVEQSGLSYGLLHSVTNPLKSWGVVRKVTFPGVNLDLGHIRNLTWTKDNDNKKWVAYNRLRGQAMSSLEQTVPERFFIDSTKCNSSLTSYPVLSLPSCPRGISAVQAIKAAAAQGQKIYTITPEIYKNNSNILLSILASHSSSTQNRIQAALDGGNEVKIHERPITEGSWTGTGYISIDVNTGAGGYIIEGASNCGYLEWWGNNGTYVGLALALVSLIAAVATIASFFVVILFFLSLFVSFMNILTYEFQTKENGCPSSMASLGNGLEVLSIIVGFFGAAGVAIGTWISFLTGGAIG